MTTAQTAGRNGHSQYATVDNVRQKFTGYERDAESTLDYAQARYYNARHGRFTSVDPLTASATIKNPQTFNRYAYALNSPYKFVDPLGLAAVLNECPDCPNENSSKQTNKLELPKKIKDQIMDYTSGLKQIESPVVDAAGNSMGEYVIVQDSKNARDLITNAAIEVFNEAENIGADRGGAANNGGVFPQTKEKDEKSTDTQNSGSATLQDKNAQVQTPSSSSSKETSTKTTPPIEARMSALDSKITTLTATTAQAVEKTDITILYRGKSVSTRFVNSSAGILTILESARNAGYNLARANRPNPVPQN